MAVNGVGNLGFGAGNSGAGGAISIVPVNNTGGSSNISGTAGVTSTTLRSVTFVVNQGTCDIDGVTFQEGTYTFGNNTFGTIDPGISFDATASTDTTILFTF
jgi:hypothetical protein